MEPTAISSNHGLCCDWSSSSRRYDRGSADVIPSSRGRNRRSLPDAELPFYRRSRRLGHGFSSMALRGDNGRKSAGISVLVRCCSRSGTPSAADGFGPYPWDPSWEQASDDNAIQWIQEELVTLFTSDGLVQIGGSLVPHFTSRTEKKQFHGKAPLKYQRYREEDYMDPKQGLCLGAIFDIVATNKLDMGRRFCVFGFCRSVEMLSDVVEDTVLEQGGEIVLAEKGSKGGLNEKLSMMVAMPLLWGVPPAVDSLNYAIRCGGGIVEKVSWQWEFLNSCKDQ